jgi:nucleotide-binding universal stress UspA family protein
MNLYDCYQSGAKRLSFFSLKQQAIFEKISFMKNIFIVTDFSNASQNAGRYGVELAKYFEAGVFLFHAYQAPVQVPESYFIYNSEDVWSTVKEQLTIEAATINPEQTVNIEICGGEGIPSKVIMHEAAVRKADLIICGMKGMGTTIRKIFGSTTTALAAKTDIPVIVVPEKANFRPPKNIALANDMDPETSSVTLNLLKELGEKFVSKLSIVWVVNEGVDGANEMRFQPKAFINELKELDPVLEFPSGSSITKTLDSFVKDHAIDMIAMIPHKRDLIERFITDSITKNMIFHTEIPLLVLPQKKIDDIQNTGNGKQVSENSVK